MEVIVGQTAGFCSGVKRAMTMTKKALQNQERVYCLGEIIHNPILLKELKTKGLRIVHRMEEVPNEQMVIFRSHGVSKQLYQEAERKKLQVLDLTCQQVRNIHNKIQQCVAKGELVVLIAKRNSLETLGTMSYGDNQIILMEQEEDTEFVIQRIQKEKRDKVSVFVQNTYSLKEFEQILACLKQQLPKGVTLGVHNTICPATKAMQEETAKIADMVELMIILGGKRSFNAGKLYEIAKQVCGNAIWVERKEELYLNYVRRFKVVGVMASVSTPKEEMQELVDLLKNIQTEGYIYENSK